jgi:hypothetical protein
MSYSLNGSSHYLQATQAIAAGDPFVLAIWIKCASLAAGVAIGFGSTTETDSYYAEPWSDGNIYGFAWDDASSSFCQVGTYTTGSWHHIALKSTGGSHRRLFLNGTGGTAVTATKAPDALGLLVLGRRQESGGVGEYFGGKIAEPAAWITTIPSDADITALAGGDSPSAYTSGLVFHARLKDDASVLVGGSLTVSGATQDADHPTVDDPPSGGSAFRRRFVSIGL